MRHRPAAVIVTASALGLGLLATALPANAATTSANLIKNPGAEAGAGATTATQVVPVPHWSRQAGVNATAVKYGAPGFPKSTTPGPSGRGKNFFAGGPMSEPGGGALMQTISLASFASKIDAGKVTFAASGWFGGKLAENDSVFEELTFSAANHTTTDDVLFGQVSASDRNNVTKLLKRSATPGTVPAGTRSVTVQLIFNGVTGNYDDGYADNLSLKLTTH
jgi:hypothetical protein